MRLVRESSGANARGGDSASCPSARGKWCFRVIGSDKEMDQKLINKIDEAIGAEICYTNTIDGVTTSTTWWQAASDCCADTHESGCGWWVDVEDVEEFKNLYKKHKKIIMAEAKCK